MQIQQIAIVTCQSLGSYTSNAESEDDNLFRFLEAKGLPVSWQVWDDENVDWSRFDFIIIKSPWDYFDKIDAFYTWLNHLETLNCKVLNPVKTMRWNADKLYFKDMQTEGIKVVQTVWLEQGSSFDAHAAFAELKSGKIIVKPRVSGGAKNTFALTLDEALAKTDEINRLLQTEPFLAQPFIEEIKTEGEWSFIFFNGNYSHTVLKTAKPGDFRVQHFFGGTIHTPQPPEHLLATARNIADKFARNCLYARVDGVALNNQLELMELELIEPFLFLHTSEGSLERYYQALMAQLQ